MNSRVARCQMFVTPTNPRFIDKAWTRGGDAYTLDMEDSIAPSEKQRCREIMREAIGKASKGGASICIRVNKPFVDADLPYAVWPGVDQIKLPKSETAEEIRHAHEIISCLEKERGIPSGHIELSPMIESALGTMNIMDLLTAAPRRIYSQGGASGYDMSVDLGIEMFADFDQYCFPAAYVALAAMARDIEAVGAIFVPNPSGRVDQRDQAALQAAALRACHVHHAGALHPAFIKPLIDGLTPSDNDVAWAETVVSEFERLSDAGEAVGELDGNVIDKYEYALAKRTLEFDVACKMKDTFKSRAMERTQAA